MSSVVVADHVFVNDDARTVHAPGAVTVSDGRIVACETISGSRPSGPGVRDLGERVVLPGLVNAHAHSPMHLIRGVAEGTSLLSMDGFLRVLRSREAHLTPDLVEAAVWMACADMIESGTTRFADQYFYADRIVPVVRAAGLRASVAWGIVELGDDATRARELDSAAKFIESTNVDDGLVNAWVGPHAFFVDNTPEAMTAEIALARRHGVGMHAHFATGGEEDRWCADELGTTALRELDRVGILDLPTILAHGNTIAVDELPLLAGRQASVAVVPSVAMVSGVTAAPVRAMLDAGVRVALGSDNVCNNTNLDLFEEMRTLGKLSAFVERRPDVVTATEILQIATTHGHRALDGGPDDGRLVPGAVADLVALPVAALHRGPVRAQSLASALVYGASGQSVTHTMVAGEWLMDDAELMTVDRSTWRQAVEADYETLMARMAPGASV